MATKAERGTKRTCQNPECGARFYDLNRHPIICPICQSPYEIASAPHGIAAVVPELEDKARKAKKPELVGEEPAVGGEVPVVEGEEALVDIEAGEEAIVTDADEAFIEEEEEDGGDVSGLLGPVGEGEEEA
jgi:uncharacterized protein (TIGR02300 family)